MVPPKPLTEAQRDNQYEMFYNHFKKKMYLKMCLFASKVYIIINI